MVKGKRTYVIAIGGNALIKEGQHGDIHQQFANTRESLRGVVHLIEQGHRVVLTHGNGPIVGNILIRNHLGEKHYGIPAMPLGICVADSQGGIGYMIQQCLQDLLIRAGHPRDVATIITQVVVDKDDPSIKNPTKPIGPFFTKEEAEKFSQKMCCSICEDSGRGFRQVVSSPFPTDIVEKNTIKHLVEKDTIVISVGGGGIPVYIEKDGTYEGVDAVVDKDFASYILAREIGADTFVILTQVEKVALDYKKPTQKFIDKMTLSEANKHFEAGQFPPGSMGPKIKAAMLFLENGGKEVIITSISKMEEALKGETGTKITLG